MSEHSEATESERVDVDLSVGSFVVERYAPDTGGVQWLAEVVGDDGNLWLMRACRTRREALKVIDDHGTSAARNAHD